MANNIKRPPTNGGPVAHPQPAEKMGYQRQKDLLQIVCALVANPSAYPHAYNDETVIEVAGNLLKKIENV